MLALTCKYHGYTSSMRVGHLVDEPGNIIHCLIKVSNFYLYDRTPLRTLAADGDPEILLGAVCLELRV